MTKISPTLGVSLLPLIFLILALSLTVYVFGADSTGGPVQITLLFATAVSALVARRLGVSWDQVQEEIRRGVSTSLSAIFILLLIGALAGTWMISGIVPTIIYYGLKIIHPSVFLFAACLTCSAISVATGSSWSTIATVGIALLGIGKTLGIHEGLVAGAVISGAYFGDKLSPLSDTTNLAAAVAGTNLFTHIRYLLYTTLPSIGVSLVVFLSIGVFNTNYVSDTHEILQVLDTLDETFVISGWLLLVPLAVIVMIAYRVPAAPVLLVGALLGSLAALIAQPHIVAKVGGEIGDAYSAIHLFTGSMKVLYEETELTTGYDKVDDLLSTGGMSGMLNTVWLILCAISFGSAMSAGGMIQRIASAIIAQVKSIGSMIAATLGAGVFFNLTTGEQYLAIIISGNMFEKAYKQQGLKPEVLSRTLEDSATVTSVLIPWNACGATQASVLGVSTLTYLPYCFFNWLSPIMGLCFALLNIRIRRTSADKSLSH